jgi:hypothetical protein
VEESCHGLICRTLPPLAWTDWGEQEPSVCGRELNQRSTKFEVGVVTPRCSVLIKSAKSLLLHKVISSFIEKLVNSKEY